MFWNISIGVSKHSVSVLCARHSDEHWGLIQTWWGMFLILREEHNLLGKLKPKRNCAVAVQWEMCDCSHNTKAGGNTWGYYAKLNKSGKYHMVSFIYGIKKEREKEGKREPWLVWLSELSTGQQTKDHQFNSWSGHMPGLRARTLAGNMMRQLINVCLEHRHLSPSLSNSLPLSLKI